MLVDKNGGANHPIALLRGWKDEHELWTFSELSSSERHVGLSGWCEETSGRWTLYVKNPTMQPYYDCVVYGYRVEHCNEPFADVEVVFGTIPPRQTMDDVISLEMLLSDHFGHPLVELEYTDSEGGHWRRDRFGRLRQIDFRRPFD